MNLYVMYLELTKKVDRMEIVTLIDHGLLFDDAPRNVWSQLPNVIRMYLQSISQRRRIAKALMSFSMEGDVQYVLCSVALPNN